jgi:hypothetical protein
MSKWPTEHHFVSWLRLCPDNRISGDKVIGKGRLPINNWLSVALKIAASTLRQSNTYLGAQFRRLKTRLGPPIAIKAMAAKLARLLTECCARGCGSSIEGHSSTKRSTAGGRSTPSSGKPPTLD